MQLRNVPGNAVVDWLRGEALEPPAIVEGLRCGVYPFKAINSRYRRHLNKYYEILKENVTLSDQEDYSVMIRATNFEKNDFSKDMKYIDEHAYNFLSKTKLHGGEILIGKIGKIGLNLLIFKIDVLKLLLILLFVEKICKCVDKKLLREGLREKL